MTNLSATIDAYGDLKAQIDALTKKQKAMKAELDSLPPGEHAGDRFVLTVSLTATDRLDMEAVREKLSPQFVRAHTITTEGIRLTLKAAARAIAA